MRISDTFQTNEKYEFMKWNICSLNHLRFHLYSLRNCVQWTWWCWLYTQKHTLICTEMTSLHGCCHSFVFSPNELTTEVSSNSVIYLRYKVKMIILGDEWVSEREDHLINALIHEQSSIYSVWVYPVLYWNT